MMHYPVYNQWKTIDSTQFWKTTFCHQYIQRNRKLLDYWRYAGPSIRVFSVPVSPLQLIELIDCQNGVTVYYTDRERHLLIGSYGDFADKSVG